MCVHILKINSTAVQNLEVFRHFCDYVWDYLNLICKLQSLYIVRVYAMARSYLHHEHVLNNRCLKRFPEIHDISISSIIGRVSFEATAHWSCKDEAEIYTWHRRLSEVFSGSFGFQKVLSSSNGPN